MNLKDTLALYKNLSAQSNFEEIERIENELKKNDRIKFSDLVEIPFRGNLQLDIVASADKSVPIVEFLYQAVWQLEHVPIEEFPYFDLRDYQFEAMMDELTTKEAKKFMHEKRSAEDGFSVMKLKEKDELTFLVEAPTQYVYVSEFYWKS